MATAGVACGGAHETPRESGPSLNEVADRYVRLTLRLALHQPSLVEAWLGPPEWGPGPRTPVAGTLDEIAVARSMLAETPASGSPSERTVYLGNQLRALHTAARRLTGESMTFDDEARSSFGIERDAWGLDADEMAAARETLDRVAGGRGPIRARVAALRRRHAVPSARVPAVLKAAVAVCQDRVEAHVAVPDGATVNVEQVRGLGVEAQATYEGRLRTRVRIDANASADLAHLVWLAAHESHAGHHLQHVLADHDLVARQGWIERALHPAFGWHLLCSEGAAEAGAGLLLAGDAHEAACREVARASGVPSDDVGDLVAIHRAVAALDMAIPSIAGAYLDGALGQEPAVDRLAEEALVGDPPMFLSVIERQRTRVLAYAVGRRMVLNAVAHSSDAERWTRFVNVSTTLTLSPRRDHAARWANAQRTRQV